MPFNSRGNKAWALKALYLFVMHVSEVSFTSRIFSQQLYKTWRFRASRPLLCFARQPTILWSSFRTHPFPSLTIRNNLRTGLAAVKRRTIDPSIWRFTQYATANWHARGGVHSVLIRCHDSATTLAALCNSNWSRARYPFLLINLCIY